MDTRDKPVGLPTERLRNKARRARDMHFPGYDEHNKGVIAVLEPWHLGVRFEGVDLAIPILLEDTSTELKRLFSHPELLPAGANEWFFHDIKHRLHRVLGFVKIQDSVETRQRVKRQKDVNSYRKKILPTHDSHRTMWQQFLHHQAPGTGFPKDLLGPRGFTQMITAPPMLMMSNREKERNGISRAMEKLYWQKDRPDRPPNSTQ
ncbi:MAG: hypothetical protein Q9222_000187 [Ikaeria aurantiellina]